MLKRVISRLCKALSQLAIQMVDLSKGSRNDHNR